MGSLANLYISQSFTSLIHLGNDSTASTQFTELQDGLGNGLGIAVNTTGDLQLDGTLSVQNLTVTGAVAIDTYFSASTAPLLNSFQPYFSNAVYVTGSYPAAGGNPPSLNDITVGWICNGINVTNGVVTSVSQSAGGTYFVIGGQYPQPAQSYTFTGAVAIPVKISGSLIISDSLIVSGTFDIEGKVVVNDNVRINGDLEVSGSQRNTGSLFVSNAISSSTITGIGNVTAFSQSLWAEFTNLENYTSSLRAAFTASGGDTIFTNNITASNIEVRNNLNVVGTINAYKLNVTIESSSVIFSSGSNILGDSILDTQTLNGTIIMSGSNSLTGSMGITGNVTAGGSGTFGGTGSFIGNLTATGNISSSTISGIGNVTTYSASVQSFITNVSSSISGTITTLSQSLDSRLDYLEGPFSTSVDLRLDNLESWSSSLQTTFVTEVELTQTASFLQNQINQKLFTSSFNSYTQSYSQSVAVTTTGLDNRINTLSSFTGSYATTGSNTFNGNQTINGTLLVSSSMVYSGSVRGQVFPITISSNTASIDCSKGNFFTLSLPAGNTRLEAANIQPGETLSLRILNTTSGSAVSSSTSVKFPTGFGYVPTSVAASTDIITFLSFDTGSIFAVAANYFA
jgi:hypothetical protein